MQQLLNRQIRQLSKSQYFVDGRFLLAINIGILQMPRGQMQGKGKAHMKKSGYFSSNSLGNINTEVYENAVNDPPLPPVRFGSLVILPGRRKRKESPDFCIN
ncbi:hypothetical protein SPOG_02636 [Schizosaccharomyces cryophilus OY26]|uniref:Uncharacterized protein n=1 Tax=Schizosaccharomyces cryophilus (strain OY26 / ATCC MYA-4695 / CBS 11777 / NBRC 106824 / NRRL Y48691) TaxID=653667 RepID=S9W086_SCHCR|nr:uncharacterized protein SPOG_02636 [Schizosaccharomyces cryophilus OY26]EPY51465.1 hypothetical protein SPOG_02636 [Schizosaccharomyces cryophilus OY26]